jgi:hypothetical protein
VSADVSQILALARDLAAAGVVAEREAQAVVSKGALNVKNTWRLNAAASAGRHARYYPSTIGYDLHVGAGFIEAVVGPDKALPQGPLGNLLEFGSVNNAPHNDGGRALLLEEPRFQAAAAALGIGVLR